jgi:hypothetical protein
MIDMEYILAERQSQVVDEQRKNKNEQMEALLLYVTSTINPRLWKLGICDMTLMIRKQEQWISQLRRFCEGPV